MVQPQRSDMSIETSPLLGFLELRRSGMPRGSARRPKRASPKEHGTCLATSLRACIFRRVALDGGMFQYVALAKDKSWQPGPYAGVELMVLHKNEATGGVAVLRKFKAGTTVPAHIHPQANEFAYVLSG